MSKPKCQNMQSGTTTPAELVAGCWNWYAFMQSKAKKYAVDVQTLKAALIGRATSSIACQLSTYAHFYLQRLL